MFGVVGDCGIASLILCLVCLLLLSVFCVCCLWLWFCLGLADLLMFARVRGFCFGVILVDLECFNFSLVVGSGFGWFGLL